MSNFTESTYSAQQVVCEHPRVIINPLLPELIAKYLTYVYRGEMRHVHKKHVHYYCFDYRPFSIKRNGVTAEDCDTCYVVDPITGETFPIYIKVPCNECDVCKQRKINAFVERCKLETQCYNSKPWFVTLTYDEQHVPLDGVSVVDLQKFLKRFRINLVRHGYADKIRYVAVGEYGKRTKRPHYHLIIWNINAYIHNQYLDIVSLLDKSWSQGFIQHRIINPENDKAFYYTAKYLKKDCVPPKNCNPFFVLRQIEAVVLEQDSLTIIPPSYGVL